MQKLEKYLSPFLFFLPAVINTLVVLWIFVYPWLSLPRQIDIPVEMVLCLLLFWGSGILLCLGKWYGGIPAVLIPAAIYIQTLSGYAGASHINWLPIAAMTVLYYAACGFLAFRRKQLFRRTC